MLELVGTFRQSQEETTISVTPEGFQMKNYIDETEDSQAKPYFFFQGADLKKNKTTKQESHQEYYGFLVEQFYLDQ